MRKRTLLAVTFVSFVAVASAYTQTLTFADFVSVVQSGTPQEVAAASAQGEDVNARGGPEDRTMLMLAATSNWDSQVVHELLEAGADVNAHGILNTQHTHMTALMFAAYANPNPDVIDVLVSAGAIVDEQDSSGMTPLMFAARDNPTPQVVTELLSKHADAKAKDLQGKTALDYAQNNPMMMRDTVAYQMLKTAS